MEIEKSIVLFVDDDTTNLTILIEILREKYTVLIAKNGEKALELARTKHPDIILLDIILPGMDGYEVCRILKGDPTTRDIPIIFVSGESESEKITAGFNAGSVDFVTKPFNGEEVIARVETHLSIKRMEAQLNNQNVILEKKVEERSAELHELNKELEKKVQLRTMELGNAYEQLTETQNQLVATEKMASLGGLIKGIAQEIENPIAASTILVLQSVKEFQKINQFLQDEKLGKKSLGNFVDTITGEIESIYKNLGKASDTVQTFKQIQVDQDGEIPAEIKIKQTIHTIVHSVQNNMFKGDSNPIKKTNHSVSINCSENLLVTTYPSILFQIITHLVMNSFNHGFEDVEQGKIEIDITKDEEKLILNFSDNGKGISEEIKDKIFEPFFTTKKSQGYVGLGLHILYNLVTERLKGSIECHSIRNEKTSFKIKIPLI